MHAARALVDGVPLEGHWFDRTREWMAERRHEKFETHDFATKYLVGRKALSGESRAPLIPQLVA